jgi:selenophosphate synthase
VLRHLTGHTHPQLLVGFDTGDDAAVWRLDDGAARVVTAKVPHRFLVPNGSALH